MDEMEFTEAESNMNDLVCIKISYSHLVVLLMIIVIVLYYLIFCRLPNISSIRALAVSLSSKQKNKPKRNKKNNLLLYLVDDEFVEDAPEAAAVRQDGEAEAVAQ